MERLLQYVWQYRLWPPRQLATVDGRSVDVLDPGRLNADAGPDFFNAKVTIGGATWAGDVEIHVRASDWHRHRHDGDPAYRSVILHVVGESDTLITGPDGEDIPQMLIPCSDALRRDYETLVAESPRHLPCADRLPSLNPLYITDWLTSLTFERLYDKADRIAKTAALFGGDLETAAYVTLARALGFGTNAEPFERLARATPRMFLLKHRDRLFTLEAMLLGQGGLLPADSPDLDPYVRRLVGEYRFMAAKFSLQPLKDPGWKMARMRPANFPHRRVAFLAALIHSVESLHSRLLAIADPADAYTLFNIEMSPFWASHYRLEAPTDRHLTGGLSQDSVNTLIINVVAPLQFYYATLTGDEEYQQRALDLLSRLPAESNRLTRIFTAAGLPCRDAAASQALIQLRRGYCEQRKCLYCRLGHRRLRAAAQP